MPSSRTIAFSDDFYVKEIKLRWIFTFYAFSRVFFEARDMLEGEYLLYKSVVQRHERGKSQEKGGGETMRARGGLRLTEETA